jgi:hypothetical protein
MEMPTLIRAEEVVGVANIANMQKMMIDKVLIVFIVMMMNEF